MPAIHHTHHSAPQHTPYSIKISSDPQSYNKCYHIPFMKTLMLQELKGAIWQKVDVIQLIELLFPDQSLDSNIDEALNTISLFQKASCGNHPSVNLAVAMVKLQNLELQSGSIKYLVYLVHAPLPTLWQSTPQGCGTVMHVSDHSKPREKPKPNIILTNDYMPHSQTAWGWGDVHTFIKVTSLSDNLTAGMKSTLYLKAFMIFQAQQNHRFVLALAICQTQLYLNVFDCAGSVHSSPIDISQQPAVVLRLLTGLVYASPSRIGYDPSITSGSKANVVYCNGHEYSVIDTLFANNMIQGRATICWHAKRGKDDYVIKDSWPNTQRTQSEYQFLEKVAELGIMGVPVLVEHEDL